MASHEIIRVSKDFETVLCFPRSHFRRSESGGQRRAKVGLMRRNCELDRDLCDPLFRGRAIYLDDHGDVCDGDTLVGRGASFAPKVRNAGGGEGRQGRDISISYLAR